MSTSDLCAINRRHARTFPYTTTLRMSGRPGGPAVIRGSRAAMEFYDAANECEHGRIPGDRLDGGAPNWPHTYPCGCWPQELSTPLRSHPTITTEEAHTLMYPDHEPEGAPRTLDPSDDAPFGYKKDGTPRKRPAPSPELIARQQAGRRKKRKGTVSAADAKALAEPPAPRGDLVTDTITALEAEIARLTKALDALKAIR